MTDGINEAWDDYEKSVSVEEINKKIADANSFEELERVIDSVKTIKGSDGYIYSADDLILKIGSVRKAEARVDIITRSHGLREKVSQLFASELIEKAKDLSDLKNKIDVVVAVFGEQMKGSDGTPLDTEIVKARIEMVVNQRGIENLVTANYGLREKALELRGMALAENV